MKILTFDTSLNKTYITFGEDENIITSLEVESNEEKYHSAFLVPEILNIFKKHNVSFDDMDAIGINEGPGSFTGIRICTVIARTAAQQKGNKVVPVSSLEILSKINNTDKKSLVLLDARKEKAYCAIYDKDGTPLKEPYSVNIEDLENIINEDNYFIISDKSMHTKLDKIGVSSLNYEEKDYSLGKYLYQIVLQKLQKNDNDYHWAKAKPLYIQPPSITMPKGCSNV